jgi:drug/metabolite transporter (DMT)-like permease
MTRHNLGRVLLWMSGALLSFSVMTVSIRSLAGTLSIIEILVTRSALGVMILMAIIVARPEMRHTIRTHRFRLHLLRNTIHFASQYCWASALLFLPLATLFALEFTTPAWTIVLAPLFLGERMTASRIGAVVLGFIGVLVVVRPGVATFHWAALLVLIAAFGYAVQYMYTKQLTATDTTFGIVFWMNTMQLVLGLVGAGVLFVGKLGLAQVPALIGLGTAGLFAHYCVTNAFRSGDTSVVVPLDFLRLPLIAMVGWWVYDEPIDGYVFLGAGLIISGIIWNLRAETRRPIPAPSSTDHAEVHADGKL